MLLHICVSARVSMYYANKKAQTDSRKAYACELKKKILALGLGAMNGAFVEDFFLLGTRVSLIRGHTERDMTRASTSHDKQHHRQACTNTKAHTHMQRLMHTYLLIIIGAVKSHSRPSCGVPSAAYQLCMRAENTSAHVAKAGRFPIHTHD